MNDISVTKEDLWKILGILKNILFRQHPEFNQPNNWQLGQSNPTYIQRQSPLPQDNNNHVNGRNEDGDGNASVSARGGNQESGRCKLYLLLNFIIYNTKKNRS